MTRRARAVLGAVSLACIALTALDARADARVCLADEAERLPRGTDQLALERCPQELTLRVLQSEHVAFQVVIEAQGEALEQVRVELMDRPRAAKLASDDEAKAAARRELRLDRFVEHFVEVPRRSNTKEGQESLGFSAEARMQDSAFLTWLPDALVPVDFESSFARYPLAIEARARGIVYLQGFVPADAEPGLKLHRLRVTAGERELAMLEVQVDILPVQLPYRVVPTFAFYDRGTLERRFKKPDNVEKQIVRELHARHLENMTGIVSGEDASRIEGMYSGQWFSPASGYRGPGPNVPNSLMVLGAYGTFGEPNAATLPLIDALSQRAPKTVTDLFVYAIDETCDSWYGPAWKSLIEEADLGGRVKVGHTCSEDPNGQGVDIIMTPAQSFDPDQAAEARQTGKEVWAYNGMLPFASPMVLDVPLTGMTLNGWISATFDVGRWFYWESIFWDDRNRGGHGDNDPFQTAETFHNADGDTTLYDGLLFFPGRVPAAFAEHDLGRDAVIPSLRLEALRRGMEDAALLSLAAQVDVGKTYDITRRIVVAALDEVREHESAKLAFDPATLRAAREELRAIILAADSPPSADPAANRAALTALRALRIEQRRSSGAGQVPTPERQLFTLALLGGGLVAIGLALSLLGAMRTRPR